MENTQAKLDELEKNNDPSKMESIRKENDVGYLFITGDCKDFLGIEERKLFT